MFVKKLKSWLPHRHTISQDRVLSVFGARLVAPQAWRFNRDAVASGIAIGLFCAYLPMPFQMLPAVAAVLYARGNLPICLLCVWITNPLTWIVLFAPAYQLGAWFMGVEPLGMAQFRGYFGTSADLQVNHRVTSIIEFLGALWLGSLMIGTLLAGTAYLATRAVWKAYVSLRWRSRRKMKLSER